MTLLPSTTFTMPPEPEAWKHSLAMWCLVLFGMAAVLKMFVDAARPTGHRMLTSIGLAVVLFVLLGIGARMLRLEAPLESRSAHDRATAAIAVTVLWIANLGVTAFSAESGSRSSRVAVAAVGLFLACAFLAVWTPRLAGSRVVARRTECRNNLKTLGSALTRMAGENGGLPAPVLFDAETPRSWRVELLPWLDRHGLRKQYHDDRPWDHAETNAHVTRTQCRPYQCPCSDSVLDAKGFPVTDYASVIGLQSAWSEKNRAKFPDVTDGASSTLLVVECSGLKIPWGEPRDADSTRLKTVVNADGAVRGESDGLASGYHYGGCHAVFADGRAHFLSKNIDPAVLNKLLTADGGETVDDF